MEPEERSMKGWSQVRRKISQEEKDAAADTRGWEAFKSSYPFLAHYWRRGEWREQVETRSVEQLREMEGERRIDWGGGQCKRVECLARERWRSGYVRVGRGGSDGGDVLLVISIYLYSIL